MIYSGISANADPHTETLRARVVHIWDYRRRQLIRSAMEKPRPGPTAYMITVRPAPGKYAEAYAGRALLAHGRGKVVAS